MKIKMSMAIAIPRHMDTKQPPFLLMTVEQESEYICIYFVNPRSIKIQAIFNLNFVNVQ